MKEHPPHLQWLVFIVEDNEMYSFMLDYILSDDYALRTVRFENGEECIRSLHLNPDMIILDFALPGINGLETYRRIKLIKPEIPVIILTGHYDRETARIFNKEGVLQYMLKEEGSVQNVRFLIEKVIREKKEGGENMVGVALRKKVSPLILAIVCFVVLIAGILLAVIIEH